MKILASDTSGSVCSVALSLGDGRYANREVASPKTHSANYMPLLDSVLNDFSLDIGDVDLFAVVTGPGSFTGTRIAVTANKCFAYSLNKKCMAFDSLELMAYPYMKMKNTLLVPMINARNRRAFAAVYLGYETVKEPKAETLDEIYKFLFEFVAKSPKIVNVIFITSEKFTDAETVFDEIHSSFNEAYKSGLVVGEPSENKKTVVKNKDNIVATISFTFLETTALAINALRYAEEILHNTTIENLKGNDNLSDDIKRRLKAPQEIEVNYLAKTQAERLRDEKLNS